MRAKFKIADDTDEELSLNGFPVCVEKGEVISDYFPKLLTKSEIDRTNRLDQPTHFTMVK